MPLCYLLNPWPVVSCEGVYTKYLGCLSGKGLLSGPLETNLRWELAGLEGEETEWHPHTHTRGPQSQ